MSNNWMDQIHKKVTKQLEKYEKGKTTLSDDDIETIMPKVVEFYNNQDENDDVFRDFNGVILLIQTPKKIFDAEGKQLNKPQKFESQFEGGETQYLIQNCKFRIHGKTQPIGIFATLELWKQLGEIYDKKAFVRANKLSLKYKMIGSDLKPLALSKFLAHFKKEDLNEIDPSEYIIYYSINMAQVIT